DVCHMTDIMPELGHEILDETGELTGLVHVMVHGRNIHWLDGLDTTIKSSDQLVLMPPSAGG
ncbi:MAG: MoaD/ThiS family protein, partial [Chloroflexota bacterium]